MPTPQPPRRSSWVQDRPVGTKVLAGVLVASAVAVGVGGLSVHSLGRLHERAVEIQDEALVPTAQLADVRRAFLQTRIDALADELLPKTGGEDVEHAAYLADVEKVDAAIATYAEGSTHTVAQRADVEALAAAWESYHTIVGGELLDLARAKDMDGYLALRTTEVKPVSKALNEALDRLEAAEQEAAVASVAAADEAYESGRTVLLTTLVLGIALSVGLGLAVVRMILRPVHAVQAAVEAMAEGDLTVAADVHSRDELGRMAAALDQAQASMRRAVSAMAESATTLSASSEELSAVSGQIAASADETSAQSAVVSA
ncbi:MAG: methyl-accepting chemotaxis protein, partial [Actinomycetota bacterium]|nr:methyl-accepting chemotaxis protein [Actinomycetota bacterium]